MQADVVLGMWKALSDRDWEKVKTFLAEDCIYVDMPVGPTAAARGPEDIVKRLKVGLEPLAGYRNHDGLLVSDGEHVMYEHSETWNWASGESTVLQFVTVHRVRDGKIVLWKDYWDFGGLLNHAPPDWMEQLATADTSWIFDATGLI
ncbi:nuclear transport factor 2 family protein [Mycolicibacterium sp.]|uniref:nuclear transport factor 2 family protein n=1 Tax=Mycolicibacterium sp. TaxID=2320850 RepID=UPI0025F2440A|nr:nuclear transport factor 2 family protein [Mycolicibacterium sp.]